MNKILFHGYEKCNQGVRWGDLILYLYICKIKAKDLGYDKIDVVYPKLLYDEPYGKLFYNNYSISTGQDSGLETIYIRSNNEDIRLEEYEATIDTTQKHSLYEDFPGIESGPASYSLYPEIVYNEKGLFLEMNPTNKGKYILVYVRQFHIDKLNKDLLFNDVNKYYRKLRNSNLIITKMIVNYIRKRYGDKYKIIGTGDHSKIDNIFDEWIEVDYNLKNNIELVMNCSLVIGQPSGPICTAYFIKDLPIIRQTVLSDWDYTFDRVIKRIFPSEVSCRLDTYLSWCKDRVYNITDVEKFDMEKIKEFLERMNL